MAIRPAHDPILDALLGARDEAAQQAALDVVAERARSVAQNVVRRKRSAALRADDADDVVANVLFRLLRQLRERPEAIGTLDAFVVTLTQNALNDFYRARFPERSRLKNRIRYMVSRDARLATWSAGERIVAGLARWRGSADVLDRAELPRERATLRLLDRNRPADALVEMLTILGKPVAVDDLVTIAAELWGIADQEPVEIGVVIDSEDTALRLEHRQRLERMWREIRELRAPQRAALLLNLRDSEGLNALALFLLAGIAPFEEIADATGLTPQRLSEIWSELPMDDLRIGAMLGATRQQVINLRKAARERLARRTNE